MSVIGALKGYIEGFAGLEEGAPVWVNYLSVNPVEYAIVPLPGARIVTTDIIGNTEREFPFAFQSAESTADDLARLEDIAFFEAFAEWLDAQSEAGELPEMDEGQTPEKIEATGWGFLFEQGESNTGIYQIQAKLSYQQVAP
jgi:hypothetical protein